MMFTGIVEEMGALAASEAAPGGIRLVFEAGTVLDGTHIGDSISVNGCCLTVVDMGPGWWASDAVPETLSRTNLGAPAPRRPGQPGAVGQRREPVGRAPGPGPR